MRPIRLSHLSHLLLLPLALTLCTQPARAGWPHDPRAPMLVAPNPGSRQTVEAAVPDGNGGAFVFFLDDRSGQNDVFAYHILPNGDRDPAWPAFGLPLCTAEGIQSDLVAVEDGQGGAFVCWLDQRVPTPANYVTRVLASGVVAPGFPADGLPMAPTLTNGHRPPRAVLDAMGGMVAVWEYEYSPTDVDIAGARILLDGSIAWHVELIPTTSNDVNPDVAVHQPGSISVAWM